MVSWKRRLIIEKVHSSAHKEDLGGFEAEI
jgi:hypothetical protein